MKKKVMLVLLCVILAATGLAGCTEEKEPVEAAKKTAEMQKNTELSEDFEDEKKPMEDSSKETETTAEATDFEEKEDDTEIQVQPKSEEVKSQEVSENVKPQKKETEKKDETKEKPKQEEQKVETPKETEESKPEPPRHTHTWEPVYAERQVEKTRLVPWTKCYACGADMTGNVYHIDEHLLNGDSNVHYGTEYREETYYETEEYVSGYSCSCGKTKIN